MSSLSNPFYQPMRSIASFSDKIYKSKYFLWSAIALGAVLRVKQYLHNRSLWADEAAVALNLIHRSFAGLLEPLEHGQGAPIGFIMLEKLSIELWGNNEYALRILPLASGLVSVFLFYLVAQRYLREMAVPLAVGLFAISEYLIVYSTELKQYSTDVAIALLLLFLADNVISQKGRPRDAVILGGVGVIAIWFSHPSIFVLAGIGITFAGIFFSRRKWDRLVGIGIIGLAWLMSAAVNYVAFLGSLQASEQLRRFWIHYFAPLPPLSFSDLKWFYDRFFEVFESPLDFRIAGVAALALIVGCYTIFRKNKPGFLFLVGPIVFCLLASGFQVYPFYGRFLLFLAPVLLLFIAEGAAEIIEKTRLNAPVVGVVFIILLMIYPLRSGVYALAKPFHKAEMKPVMQCMKQNYETEDLVYLHFRAVHAFKYYRDRYGFSDSHSIDGTNQLGGSETYMAEVDGLRGNNRVWFVFSLHGRDGAPEQGMFLHYLDRVGRQLKVCKSSGAASYLYDLRTE